MCETRGAPRILVGASEVPICSERAAEIKIGGDGERGVKGKGKGVLRTKRNSRFGQNYIKSCMHGSGLVPCTRTRTLAITTVRGAQGGGRDQSGARWSRSAKNVRLERVPPRFLAATLVSRRPTRTRRIAHVIVLEHVISPTLSCPGGSSSSPVSSGKQRRSSPRPVQTSAFMEHSPSVINRELHFNSHHPGDLPSRIFGWWIHQMVF